MKPVLFADDPQFWFETLRAVGHAAYGGRAITTATPIAALMCVFRLSQLCARPCYVAGGGWCPLSPLVGGWAVPLPAT